jgi:hypothetical protein
MLLLHRRCRGAAQNPAILTAIETEFIECESQISSKKGDRVSEPNRVGQRLVRWVVVLVPLSWGVYATLQKAVHLFH